MDTDKIAKTVSTVIRRYAKRVTVPERMLVKGLIGYKSQTYGRKYIAIDELAFEDVIQAIAKELERLLPEKAAAPKGKPTAAPAEETYPLSEEVQGTLLTMGFTAREVHAIRLPKHMQNATAEEQLTYALGQMRT